MAILNQPLNGVGDLQLIPPGWFDGFAGLYDQWGEEVHPHQGIIGGRDFGLLHQAPDAPVWVQVGHTEALRIVDRGEQNACAAAQTMKTLLMADYAIS